MRVTVFASGSTGNCALVQAGGERLLIDAGISLRRLGGFLAAEGLSPSDLSCVLVTHEHADHVCGLSMLTKKHGTRVIAPRTVAARLRGMLPGVDAKALAGAKIDEKQMAHTEAIIQSMTPKERDNPSIINFSRKKRIAAGCGLTVEQVNRLLKQFEAMQKMTKQLTGMARGKGKKKRRGFPGLGGLGGMKLPF